jgi:anti-anti-sigma regulatory factor
MRKIERIANGNVVFKLSGRMDAENVSEFETLINAEASGRRVVLEKVTTVKETSWQQQHNGLRT